MARTTPMTVRIGWELSEFVASNVSEDARDVIRRDKGRAEKEAFVQLKAALKLAFLAPEEGYVPMTAEQFLARHHR